MARQVILAAQHLHQRGLAHGDIKALNVSPNRRARTTSLTRRFRAQAVRFARDQQLRLIDLDAAVRISGGFAGAKFSSAVLPPEMIYELKDERELRQIQEYWREEMESDTELWRKIAPKANKFVVKSFRTVGDTPDLSCPLPYNLVEASAAIDLWSLGALIFLLIMGETLVPSNRDDDCVDATAMATLCGWTDETTRERLGKVDNIAARDLLSHLLVVAPAQQLAYSLDDAL